MKYVRKDFRISLLPFDHEEAEMFTVHAREVDDSRYEGNYRQHGLITRDGRLMPAWAARAEAYAQFRESMCQMSIDELTKAADLYMSRISVNGWTLKDILLLDTMSAEDWRRVGNPKRKERNQTKEFRDEQIALTVGLKEIEESIPASA